MRRAHGFMQIREAGNGTSFKDRAGSPQAHRRVLKARRRDRNDTDGIVCAAIETDWV
jgi:hypothetical protein